MALRAYQRAQWLAPGGVVAGAGCTASLATDRPKRGDHRFHMTGQTADRLLPYFLTPSTGARARGGEGALLGRVLLNARGATLGVADRVPLPLVADETIQVETIAAVDPLARMLRAEVTAVHAGLDGRLGTEAPRPGLLLPGSFNPVHEGHWGMAAAAGRLAGLVAALAPCATDACSPALARQAVR